ncbi:MAG TPA: 3-hydroxyacyl-[acyl-carrier-protein] dehydratase FabZ [Lachnospiraceae bacterium]|nr:3-hydroxyacyl-[acyl-carrier-protein] dehydratase FabZ [Lachnospiraceae bacterium]
MDFEEIKKMIPQRFPIIMVDRVESFEKGKSITALKNVSGNEMHFLGHFPEQAVMPGVLTIEAMAQTAGILAMLTYADRERASNKYFFGSVNKLRFLKPIVPGDQMKIYVEAIKMTSVASLVKAEVKVDDTVVAAGELSFALPK